MLWNPCRCCGVIKLAEEFPFMCAEVHEEDEEFPWLEITYDSWVDSPPIDAE